MSNFNSYMKNKGVETIVNKFFNEADSYNPDVKIISFKHYLEDFPDRPAAYYLENGLTACMTIRLEYITSDNPEETKVSTIELPREVDGVFIIEGAYRVATSNLNSDKNCRIYMSGTGDCAITFGLLKFDLENDKYFTVNRRYDIRNKTLYISVGDKELPITQREIRLDYNEIDTYEKKEYLKLTEEQSKKFQIKLDLDYVPEYITAKLIDQCIEFGDDREKDLIVDKYIGTVARGFMDKLIQYKQGSFFYKSCRDIKTYFGANGFLQDSYPTFTNFAISYFKGAGAALDNDDDREDQGDIQVAAGINAINLQSIESKITLSEFTAYNSTMADIIDIADTPINQNTNLQNSLTVATTVTDEGIMFDVYDLNFTRITIPYIDYLNSKVCSSDFVDYKTNTLKPNKDGEVEVKHRMKRKMVKVEDIQLIDLHPDYRLSEATRRIPFLNSTDSVRISMGTSMLKQSIPLVNAQRAIVETGRNEELSNNVFNEKFIYDEGTVKEINESEVVIKLKNGSLYKHPRRTAVQSINDVCIYTNPKVKVGQKLKKGDIITGAHNLEKDTYKVGLNTLVLFHAYHGLVNEDALVVSESYANRMCHYSIIDVVYDVKYTTALKWIAPIGTKVKFGDPIVKALKTNRLNEVNAALATKLGGLFGEGNDFSAYLTEDSLKVPNNIDEAWVSDVMIQENVEPNMEDNKVIDFSYSHTSKKVIDDYMSTLEKDRKVIYDKFPEYLASDRLRNIKMTSNYTVVYTVRVRLIKKTKLMIGSKVTNRYGGKGVISAVKPDELMPIMVDSLGKQHRVEAIMNPYSTIGRKIAGVLLEQELGLIAHKLYDLVEDYKRTKTGQKKILPLLEKYYPGRFSDMDVEQFINHHNTNPIEEVYYFQVGCYSEYTPEKIENMMNELNLESQSTILMPETELTDLGELKDNLSEEEYEKYVKSITGKFIQVEKKLQCGWLTLEELYHIPSYSNKVTTSLFGPRLNPKKDDPILGRGKYRATGQSIGEMESWAYLSRNAREFISSTHKDTAKEENQLFLNNLLGLGLTIADDKGYNQGGSRLKEDINSMKTKFRLRNRNNN